MSSTQPRKQQASSNNNPSNEVDELTAKVTPTNPVSLTPKEQFKYGDVKVTSPGVGKVTIVIH